MISESSLLFVICLVVRWVTVGLLVMMLEAEKTMKLASMSLVLFRTIKVHSPSLHLFVEWLNFLFFFLSGIHKEEAFKFCRFFHSEESAPPPLSGPKEGETKCHPLTHYLKAGRKTLGRGHEGKDD